MSERGCEWVTVCESVYACVLVYVWVGWHHGMGMCWAGVTGGCVSYYYCIVNAITIYGIFMLFMVKKMYYVLMILFYLRLQHPRLIY